MKRFEYQITKHPAEAFKELVYFCSESAECTLEQVPTDQTKILQDILNERGRQGWELIQVSFGKDGIMAFWKQKLQE
ncbi:MAG: DUF4177 domain-containing protein [Deltaproteobacteria bacterium]|jgi:hypothetical protein|nr:MAG: DUF4177 domain-containing protein [Deltaproteobacteria bacterium]